MPSSIFSIGWGKSACVLMFKQDYFLALIYKETGNMIMKILKNEMEIRNTKDPLMLTCLFKNIVFFLSSSIWFGIFYNISKLCLLFFIEIVSRRVFEGFYHHFKISWLLRINQLINQLANSYYVLLEYPVLPFHIPLRDNTAFSVLFLSFSSEVTCIKHLCIIYPAMIQLLVSVFCSLFVCFFNSKIKGKFQRMEIFGKWLQM